MPLVRPQIIEVPVVQTVPVPATLTDPLPEPVAPPHDCVDHGRAAVCVLDALATIPAWRGVVEQCNADRAAAAALTGKP